MSFLGVKHTHNLYFGIHEAAIWRSYDQHGSNYKCGMLYKVMFKIINLVFIQKIKIKSKNITLSTRSI